MILLIIFFVLFLNEFPRLIFGIIIINNCKYIKDEIYKQKNKLNINIINTMIYFPKYFFSPSLRK